MNQRRHLSSLRPGMDALSVLAMSGRMTAAELAKRIKVPRTTAHRILDTLVAEGYVIHNTHNHCFQLGPQVCRLAQGHRRDELISEVARPILRTLCREILLPCGLTAPVGTEVMLQISMDHEAPLASHHLPEGFYFPANYGACGRLFLAHCTEDERRHLIAAALSSSQAYLSQHAVPTNQELDQIRELGFALAARPAHPLGVLAAPVFLRGDYVAGVHIRFPNQDADIETTVRRHLPRLQCAARDVEAALTSALSKRTAADAASVRGADTGIETLSASPGKRAASPQSRRRSAGTGAVAASI